MPDHYVFRMLHSQGVALADLGVPRADGGPTETDGRAIWRRLAENYHLLRGTPSRLWLDHTFETVFGLDRRLSAETADDSYDHIADCLARPEFRPRALFERFGIEVIATTESPLDDLRWHAAIRELGLGRPGDHRLPARRRGRPGVPGLRRERRALRRDHRLRHRRLGRLPRGAPAAARPSSRRTARPAATTATPPPAPRTCRAPRRRRCSGGRWPARRSPEEADRFRGHMLTEMARMSLDDGLVLQIHPGSFRNHSDAVLRAASAATRASTSRPAPTTCGR